MDFFIDVWEQINQMKPQIIQVMRMKCT